MYYFKSEKCYVTEMKFISTAHIISLMVIVLCLGSAQSSFSAHG